jgi:hypothetical protein
MKRQGGPWRGISRPENAEDKAVLFFRSLCVLCEKLFSARRPLAENRLPRFSDHRLGNVGV